MLFMPCSFALTACAINVTTITLAADAVAAADSDTLLRTETRDTQPIVGGTQLTKSET